MKRWYYFWTACFVVCIVLVIYALKLSFEIAGQKELYLIRTFDNAHTIIWHDTLWTLEPVELDKARVVVK